jgi:hypothetical protein
VALSSGIYAYLWIGSDRFRYGVLHVGTTLVFIQLVFSVFVCFCDVSGQTELKFSFSLLKSSVGPSVPLPLGRAG